MSSQQSKNANIPVENFIHDEHPQSFYDSYNDFIFSADSKIFNKLLSKRDFLELTKSVPGDIVELGVFKGSGMAGWLKMCRYSFINNKKVVGFDIFDDQKLLTSIGTKDKNLMGSLFAQRSFASEGYAPVLNTMLRDAGFNNYEIVTGNVFDTIPGYLDANPGFRASVINFDLDTAEPTYFSLTQLWDRLVKGGVLIFDEYAINEWTESIAVDQFVNEFGLDLKRTQFEAPSAYIIKT